MHESRVQNRGNHPNPPLDRRDDAGENGGGRLGDILVSKGLLTRRQLAQALDQQRKSGGRLGQLLVDMGMLSREEMTCTLADQFATDRVHIEISDIDMRIARLVPESLCARFGLVALGEEGNKVIVAMADPLDVVAADAMAMKLDREIRIVVSSPEEIRQAIEAVYHGSDIDEQHLRDLVELEVESEQPQTESELEAIRRSVARGQPYGNDAWRKHTAIKLDLESTMRSRGRSWDRVRIPDN